MTSLRNGSKGQYYGSTFNQSEPLTVEQMTVNVRYIYTYLISKGWSIQAICAMVGNMQAESSINPGRWQSEDVGNTSLGYGLVQWTPSTKYTSWCGENGFADPSEMDANLSRILYEVESNLQWIATNEYPLTFKEFTQSGLRIEDLAKAFLLCYERPADQSASVREYRGSLARNWYNVIINNSWGSGSSNPSGGTTSKTKKSKYKFLLFNARKRSREWIR